MRVGCSGSWVRETGRTRWRLGSGLGWLLDGSSLGAIGWLGCLRSWLERCPWWVAVEVMAATPGGFGRDAVQRAVRPRPWRSPPLWRSTGTHPLSQYLGITLAFHWSAPLVRGGVKGLGTTLAFQWYAVVVSVPRGQLWRSTGALHWYAVVLGASGPLWRSSGTRWLSQCLGDNSGVPLVRST